MKHNKTWFHNRIGKKVYCTDHEKKNKDWTECKGIEIENDLVADNLNKFQNRGVEFGD